MPTSHKIITSQNNTMALSNPLISTIVTLYTLIYLYLPTIIFSPVLISSYVLLLFFLKLGAAQRISLEQHKKIEAESEPENPSLQASRDFTSHDEGTSCEVGQVFDPFPQPDPDSKLDPTLQVPKVSAAYHHDVNTKCEMDPVFDPNLKPDPDSDHQTLQAPVFGPVTKPDPDIGCVVKSSCIMDPAPDPDPESFYGNSLVEVIHHDCTTCGMDAKANPVYDPQPDPRPSPLYDHCFVEWNVRAPLEVIYEEYEGEGEGEEEEEEDDNEGEGQFGKLERYGSLSMYYLETDTNTDTDIWSDQEDYYKDDEGGLIEIELDYSYYCKRINTSNNSEVFEEDNLIEIDLNFPVR